MCMMCEMRVCTNNQAKINNKKPVLFGEKKKKKKKETLKTLFILLPLQTPTFYIYFFFFGFIIYYYNRVEWGYRQSNLLQQWHRTMLVLQPTTKLGIHSTLFLSSSHCYYQLFVLSEKNRNVYTFLEVYIVLQYKVFRWELGEGPCCYQ